MFFKKLLYYINPLNLFKSDTNNINLKMMHGINKISILMFLICLGVLIYRWLS